MRRSESVVYSTFMPGVWDLILLPAWFAESSPTQRACSWFGTPKVSVWRVCRQPKNLERQLVKVTDTDAYHLCCHSPFWKLVAICCLGKQIIECD
jgi:hypothetical protein